MPGRPDRETDLELSINDGQVLPNELIHAWFGNSAIASLDEQVASSPRRVCDVVALSCILDESDATSQLEVGLRAARTSATVLNGGGTSLLKSLSARRLSPLPAAIRLSLPNRMAASPRTPTRGSIPTTLDT